MPHISDPARVSNTPAKQSRRKKVVGHVTRTLKELGRRVLPPRGTPVPNFTQLAQAEQERTIAAGANTNHGHSAHGAGQQGPGQAGGPSRAHETSTSHQSRHQRPTEHHERARSKSPGEEAYQAVLKRLEPHLEKLPAKHPFVRLLREASSKLKEAEIIPDIPEAGVSAFVHTRLSNLIEDYGDHPSRAPNKDYMSSTIRYCNKFGTALEEIAGNLSTHSGGLRDQQVLLSDVEEQFRHAKGNIDAAIKAVREVIQAVREERIEGMNMPRFGLRLVNPKAKFEEAQTLSESAFDFSDAFTNLMNRSVHSRSK